MTNEEVADVTAAGFDLLLSQAKIIALLPLEGWLQAFDLADAAGPVVDPTLYREYLWSRRGDLIKEVIRAAIPLKQAMLRIQPKALEILEREAARKTEEKA